MCIGGTALRSSFTSPVEEEGVDDSTTEEMSHLYVYEVLMEPTVVTVCEIVYGELRSPFIAHLLTFSCLWVHQTKLNPFDIPCSCMSRLPKRCKRLGSQ